MGNRNGCDTPTYSEKEIKKLQDNIKKTKKLIETVEKAGGKMPKLKKAVKHLEIAINTGTDIAKAADEASRELKIHTDDLHKACGDDFVCKAKIDRKWQARAVKWTLDPSKDNSVLTKTMNKTMARYAPKAICKLFDGCAKELKKQEKKCK